MTRHRTASHPSRRPRRLLHVETEPLEGRALLSVAGPSEAIAPAVASIVAARGGGPGGGQSGSGLTNPTPNSSALTPAQILGAYSFSKSSTAGAATTIAIVDAYNDPNIQADLAAFDAQYFPGRPAASLTVLNQNGQKTNLPATDPGWSLEIALDVEWAHVAAPGAKLVLVEADSASLGDLTTAVQTAAQQANVVSMSWGGGEFWGQQAFDTAAYFANPNVTFVAASGDDGGAHGAEWPASSPYVLGVGGTTLSASSAGAYLGETAWNASWSWGRGGLSFSGGGGGVSRIEPSPAYQTAALGAGYASGRAVPDVSMDADPSSGVSVFDSVSGLGQTGWFKVGGTSAGAPIWSGLVADADQARLAAGLLPLSSTQTLNMLYSFYGSNAAYAGAFHDVVSGVTFAGYATPGYDLATGLGSPVAAAIIQAAAGSSSSASLAVLPASQSVGGPGQAHGVGADDQTPSTTDQTAARITAAEIRFVLAALASQPASPPLVEAAPLVHAAGVDVEAAAPGLPNQSSPASIPHRAAGIDFEGSTAIVYLGLDSVPALKAAPSAVPGTGPGDFPTPAPPILNPSTPIGVWDEALAWAQDEVDRPSAAPPAPAPWNGSPETTAEDGADAAPRLSLLGAAGVAVALGVGWNRRLAEEDRRFRIANISSLSID